MQPNILFILIDGLRADQCFGVDKTAATTFLDSLITSGTYFKNTFASADGTIISLNCMLNSKFQFETGIRAQKIILLEDNNLQILKNSGYHINGLIPKLTALKPITDYFQNENHTYDPGSPPESLSTGITEKILFLLNSLKNTSPWFCYLHLFDLHPSSVVGFLQAQILLNLSGSKFRCFTGTMSSSEYSHAYLPKHVSPQSLACDFPTFW